MQHIVKAVDLAISLQRIVRRGQDNVGDAFELGSRGTFSLLTNGVDAFHRIMLSFARHETRSDDNCTAEAGGSG